MEAGREAGRLTAYIGAALEGGKGGFQWAKQGGFKGGEKEIRMLHPIRALSSHTRMGRVLRAQLGASGMDVCIVEMPVINDGASSEVLKLTK